MRVELAETLPPHVSHAPEVDRSANSRQKEEWKTELKR
jgi:hypothetical protein